MVVYVEPLFCHSQSRCLRRTKPLVHITGLTIDVDEVLKHARILLMLWRMKRRQLWL